METADKVAAMEPFGVILGLITLLVIGLGFVWVIYGERYFGADWAGVVLGVGIMVILLSALIQNDWIAAIVGIWGASMVWGGNELRVQKLRVKLGWFAKHERKILPPFRRLRKS